MRNLFGFFFGMLRNITTYRIGAQPINKNADIFKTFDFEIYIYLSLNRPMIDNEISIQFLCCCFFDSPGKRVRFEWFNV